MKNLSQMLSNDRIGFNTVALLWIDFATGLLSDGRMKAIGKQHH